MRVNTENLVRVGFWSGGYPNDATLPDPADLVDSEWDSSEREAVVQHLTSSPVVRSMRGPSRCRICNARNGSQERADDQYTWPSGFAHYLTEHDVKPDQAFIAHVLAQVAV